MLARPGQVGHIPTMNTGPLVGISVTAYKSADIALTHCEAAGGILLRQGGSASEGHEESKGKFPTQRTLRDSWTTIGASATG